MNKKTLISLVVIVAVISTASAIFYSCRRDPSKPAYTEDLLRRAQEGDVNAEFFIGRSYYDGNGVPPPKAPCVGNAVLDGAIFTDREWTSIMSRP